jgi:hypothetical protein
MTFAGLDLDVLGVQFECMLLRELLDGYPLRLETQSRTLSLLKTPRSQENIEFSAPQS